MQNLIRDAKTAVVMKFPRLMRYLPLIILAAEVALPAAVGMVHANPNSVIGGSGGSLNVGIGFNGIIGGSGGT